MDDEIRAIEARLAKAKAETEAAQEAFLAGAPVVLLEERKGKEEKEGKEGKGGKGGRELPT